MSGLLVTLPLLAGFLAAALCGAPKLARCIVHHQKEPHQ